MKPGDPGFRIPGAEAPAERAMGAGRGWARRLAARFPGLS